MGAFIGYIASALLLGTFGARTMMPLRIIAVIGNAAFAVYGYWEQLHLVTVLNLVILPLNIWRLIEIIRVVRSFRGAVDEHKIFDALIPFAKHIAKRRGEVVLSKGDPSDALYLVLKGSLWVVEAATEIKPGSIVGEIGVMSATHLRTATVEAKTDCELARISAEDFLRVYYTNPAIGLSLVRLIIDRLTQQVEGQRLSAAEAAGLGSAPAL